MYNYYGKPDADVRIQDVIDGMMTFAKEHSHDHVDCDTNASGIEEYALDLQEAWDMTKEHPEEWCNCDTCVVKSERTYTDTTLMSALIRIRDKAVNTCNDDADFLADKLGAIWRIAECALKRIEYHDNNPNTNAAIKGR